MPHDMHGRPLAEGDIVNMRMRVKALYPGETACNVTLVALDGAESEYKPEVACNTSLVSRAINGAAITADDVWGAFNALESALRDAKPHDRSNADRAFAITLTEVEKAMAYFNMFVLGAKNDD